MSEREIFEGREVIEHEIVVIGATADSETSDPFYVGDVVYVVCEAVIDRVTHKAVKGADKLTRIATARALISAVVDRDVVRDAIDMARMAAESKSGVLQLGFDDDD